jgi:hypothetical protein
LKQSCKLTEVLKKVSWYEQLLNVAHEVHLHLAHARDPRSHKTHIDKVWWGVTEEAIKVYQGTCHEYLRKTNPETMQRVKFTFSETIQSHALRQSLVKVLAIKADLPEILQSDNGGAFMARCIAQIQKNYPAIHIV